MCCVYSSIRQRRIRQQRMNRMVTRNFTPQVVVTTTSQAPTPSPIVVTGGGYGATTAYPVATAVPQAVAQPMPQAVAQPMAQAVAQPIVSNEVPIAVATAVPQMWKCWSEWCCTKHKVSVAEFQWMHWPIFNWSDVDWSRSKFCLVYWDFFAVIYIYIYIYVRIAWCFPTHVCPKHFIYSYTQQIFEYTVYNCIGIPTRVIEIFLICCLVFLCLNAMIVYFTKHTPYDHRWLPRLSPIQFTNKEERSIYFAKRNKIGSWGSRMDHDLKWIIWKQKIKSWICLFK